MGERILLEVFVELDVALANFGTSYIFRESGLESIVKSIYDT